jgi:hypothetical protein
MLDDNGVRMLSRREDFVRHRVALLGARLAIARILLSGPVHAGVP